MRAAAVSPPDALTAEDEGRAHCTAHRTTWMVGFSSTSRQLGLHCNDNSKAPASTAARPCGERWFQDSSWTYWRFFTRKQRRHMIYVNTSLPYIVLLCFVAVTLGIDPSILRSRDTACGRHDITNTVCTVSWDKQLPTSHGYKRLGTTLTGVRFS